MEKEDLMEFLKLILDDEFGIPMEAWDFLIDKVDIPQELLDIVDGNEGRVFVDEGVWYDSVVN